MFISPPSLMLGNQNRGVTTSRPAAGRIIDRRSDLRFFVRPFPTLSSPLFKPVISVQGAPLRIPVSPPDTVHINQVALLNHRLQNWGFHDNPRQYIVILNEEYERVSQERSKLETWTLQKEEWISEGDTILNDIQSFMCGGYLDYLTPDGLEEIWRRLTCVVFKIQYMMAAVETRLDARLRK